MKLKQLAGFGIGAVVFVVSVLCLGTFWPLWVGIIIVGGGASLFQANECNWWGVMGMACIMFLLMLWEDALLMDFQLTIACCLTEVLCSQDSKR